MIFENVDILFDVCKKCSLTPRELSKNLKNRAWVSVAANLGYEIRAHLHSLLKSTRTLIAKAIGRELVISNESIWARSNSFKHIQ